MNNEIEILLKKRVHANFATVSSDDIILHRTMKIPMQPFIGMYINNSNFTFEENIIGIAYNYETNVIICHVEEDKELYDKELKSAKDFLTDKKRLAEIVKEYEEVGWITNK